MDHIEVPVLASYFLEPIAILASIFLTYFNHTCKRRSSATLLLFWPLFACAVGVWIRTRVSIRLDFYFPILVAKAIVCGLGLLSFLLECVGPEYGAESQLGEKLTQESPILTANIFSIWVSFSSDDYKPFLIGVLVGIQLDDSIDEEGR